MENVVLIIHLILALSLIAVVLLQRSEGGGLGMGGGGGAMTGRAAATALAKVTWILAAGFIITSLALTIIAAQKSSTGSVLDRVGISSAPVENSAPADTEVPATAPDGGSLLPPPSGSSSTSDLTPSAD